MFPSALVIDANFEGIGEDAVYTPLAGLSVPVKVMPKTPDTVIGIEGSRLYTPTAIFDIRVSEVANPKEGDQIAFKGTTYKVQGKPVRHDGDRLIWTISTYPA